MGCRETIFVSEVPVYRLQQHNGRFQSILYTGFRETRLTSELSVHYTLHTYTAYKLMRDNVRFRSLQIATTQHSWYFCSLTVSHADA